jgi:hypothetical protein
VNAAQTRLAAIQGAAERIVAVARLPGASSLVTEVVRRARIAVVAGSHSRRRHAASFVLVVAALRARIRGRALATASAPFAAAASATGTRIVVAPAAPARKGESCDEAKD